MRLTAEFGVDFFVDDVSGFGNDDLSKLTENRRVFKVINVVD